MSSRAQSSPAFGTADLSNCEREQIHLAGSIQPFGAFLLVREPDLEIVQTSANAAEFLNLEGSLLGRPLGALPGDLFDRIRPYLDTLPSEIPAGVRCELGQPRRSFDVLLHRPEGGGLALELERAGPGVDLSRHGESALKAILACASLQGLCDEAAKLFRDLTGYDRVMVYRFDEEGHGQVFSERKKPRLESFLGNWYPASDIPQMARRLYERNRVRILVDVAAEQIPLTPKLSPLSGRDLDMSLCFLRSMSPLHMQYLRNMGVAATLVVSLMVGGKLWGLVACHHYGPRFVHFEVRAVCELLAEAMATRILALDAFAQAQAELSVRRLEQRMVDAISKEGDWRAALFDKSPALLTPVGAEGAALLLDGQILTTGEVPGTLQIRAIGAWLDAQPPRPVFATGCLRRDMPDLAALMPEVGGLLAAPISSLPGDHLVWFRPERIKTVTWGGDPFKPFSVGDDPRDLSPRRSFSQWHELVEGTCEPWTAPDLTGARLIGETVADVVLQFRSLRLLIVQDQLETVRRQVEASPQPVILADARGTILLTNGAFRQLLADRPPPVRLADLAACFTDPKAIEPNLRDLTRHRRAWRGEALFDADPPLPLLVRADPVLSSPGRVLGFVLLFMDVSQRHAVETARRRFQDRIGTPQHLDAVRLDAVADPVYRGLVSAMVENAQMAAFEIADGLDMGRIPAMLDSIRGSVDRAAEILGRLVWHARRAANDDR